MSDVVHSVVEKLEGNSRNTVTVEQSKMQKLIFLTAAAIICFGAFIVSAENCFNYDGLKTITEFEGFFANL